MKRRKPETKRQEQIMSRKVFCLVLLPLLASFLWAAEPPSSVNYQGVLRDSFDKPLDGSYDMIFKFFSAAGLGDEIMIDQHLAAGTGAVTVSDGMFNTQLGGGAVSDGSGSGVYVSLTQVFRDYSAVYLEVQVYNADTSLWETLSPRIRVLSAAYALNADHLDGKSSAEFLDTSSTAQTKTGAITINASASPVTGFTSIGQLAGGYFVDSNNSGAAYAGVGDRGIEAWGNDGGGYFADSSSGSYAYAGYGDYGIEAHGGGTAGYFVNASSSKSWLATSASGISATGSEAGGYFYDTDNSGYAYAGYGDYGVQGFGDYTGGYFRDATIPSTAWAYVGYAAAARGIEAYGADQGGYFRNNAPSNVYLAHANYGVWATHPSIAGYFSDSNESAWAFIAYGNFGVWARGSSAGGSFGDGVAAWADVARPTAKIVGTGGVSFVQNHPYDDNRVIVYSAPEGDEVATFTRGTARLTNGEARVPLGETFAWVTNPDIGLTAHLTPHGECQGLFIDSLSTDELVVREAGGGTSHVSFDYIVYGLRIGFEEAAVVQPKVKEALLPEPSAFEKEYGGQQLELRTFNALERYTLMAQKIGSSAPSDLDMSRSQALRQAIMDSGHQKLGLTDPRLERPDMKAGERQEPEPLEPGSSGEMSSGEPSIPIPVSSAPTTIAETHQDLVESEEDDAAIMSRATLFPVSEIVEAGDLLVLDSRNPGSLRRAEVAADPAVVGIACGEAITAEGKLQVPVALCGVAIVKVDASYGAVFAGDLLITSPTPSHAMSIANPAPGTVVGKALEPLASGTGMIKVLVMLR